MGKGFIRTIFAGLIIFGAGFGLYAGIDKIKYSSLFTINKLEIKGVVNADKIALQNFGKEFIGLNLFDSRLNGAIESRDPWIQKIVAKRVMPDKVVLMVYEEKALFKYKNKQNKCNVFTGGAKNMPVPCDDVLISSNTDIDIDNAMKFALLLEEAPFLKETSVVLKDYNFEAIVDGDKLILPYDYELFKNNLALYQNKIRHRYRKVEYANLTVEKRIYVKGVQHDS